LSAKGIFWRDRGREKKDKGAGDETKKKTRGDCESARDFHIATKRVCTLQEEKLLKKNLPSNSYFFKRRNSSFVGERRGKKVKTGRVARSGKGEKEKGSETNFQKLTHQKKVHAFGLCPRPWGGG
jgi:hypothetical protein